MEALECPCMHNGVAYPPGSELVYNCLNWWVTNNIQSDFNSIYSASDMYSIHEQSVGRL